MCDFAILAKPNILCHSRKRLWLSSCGPCWWEHVWIQKTLTEQDQTCFQRLCYFWGFSLIFVETKTGTLKPLGWFSDKFNFHVEIVQSHVFIVVFLSPRGLQLPYFTAPPLQYLAFKRFLRRVLTELLRIVLSPLSGTGPEKKLRVKPFIVCF